MHYRTRKEYKFSGESSVAFQSGGNQAVPSAVSYGHLAYTVSPPRIATLMYPLRRKILSMGTNRSAALISTTNTWTLKSEKGKTEKISSSAPSASTETRSTTAGFRRLLASRIASKDKHVAGKDLDCTGGATTVPVTGSAKGPSHTTRSTTLPEVSRVASIGSFSKVSVTFTSELHAQFRINRQLRCVSNSGPQFGFGSTHTPVHPMHFSKNTVLDRRYGWNAPTST
mmetsp:Transcript_85189/g.194313  ORF Transcript_85189/g.194313 Transcript_85189/m.194313 type:complete len:227 (+) Transcript_85189:403-1083(+)